MHDPEASNALIDREWLTAKLADPCLVRRCIGRLDTNTYEYRVVFDDRQLRLLVRRGDIEPVLELLADLTSGPFYNPRLRQGNRNQHIRLLAAIPLGAAIGSILSAILALPASFGTTISAICACLAAFVATGLMPTWSIKKRLMGAPTTPLDGGAA